MITITGHSRKGKTGDKTFYWKQEKDLWLPEVVGKEREMKEVEHRGFLETTL